MNILKRYVREKNAISILNAFKKKSSHEILCKKVDQMLSDLLISGFTNKEISIIIQSLSKEAKSVLENRKMILENELKETCEGINNL